MSSFKWLLVILLLALGLRIWNVNWDDGHHFHPDERWIVMVAERLEWVNPVTEWEVFKSVDSPMNPKFFAYGSLPIYLLAFVGWLASFFRLEWGQYSEINLVGRVMSAVFDTGTVLLIFLLGKRLFGSQRFGAGFNPAPAARELGLWMAGFYAVSLLPIQLSHFYAVDTILTFFVMLTLYLLIKWTEVDFGRDPGQARMTTRMKSLWLLLVVGLTVGMAMATKISGVFLAVPIVVTILIRVIRSGRGIREGLEWLVLRGMIAILMAGVVFMVFEPYALIDWQTFVRNHQEQARMTRDAWIFPYTLQYVGTKSYYYFIEQYVRFGVGWGLGLMSLIGIVVSVWCLVFGVWCRANVNNKNLLIILSFVVVYFGYVGISAVKFMRYTLPVYPALCLLAGLGIWVAVLWFRSFKVSKFDFRLTFLFLCSFVFLLTSLWTVAFMSEVYGQENTRIVASRWLAEKLETRNTKFETVLGIEHWDDALPVPPWHAGFEQVVLPLYDPDTERKWHEIAVKLEQVDAIVLASNRLSTPLMRLKEKYPVTNRYFELLFSGELGFEEVADFHVQPGIGQWLVDTQLADESFQVYDHPRVRIFSKAKSLTQYEYWNLLYSLN